jgi:predicted metal-dependent peptidase
MAIQMVSELGGALDEGVADKLTIVYFDDGIRCVDEFETGDRVTARTMGGGGTNYRPCFEWVRDYAQDAACIIFLTDLCTTDWGDEPHCPIMWGAFLHDTMYEQLSKAVPFGEVVHVSREM